MSPDFSDALGITEDELLTYFPDYITRLAREEELSRQALLASIKTWYNGFCFSMRCQQVYNPYSLIRLFQDNVFSIYWFATGTPTLLIKLIKDQQIIEDNWQVIDADFEGELSDQNSIVPLSYWLENKATLASKSNIGVWLDSHEEPSVLAEDANSLPVIAINFPKFADGRGYSYARLLRERFNFEGEIRAIGDVLQDQLFYRDLPNIVFYFNHRRRAPLIGYTTKIK